MTLLAFTGLRISEACGLTWDCIDFVDGELHVREQLARTTKSQQSRLVPTKTRSSASKQQ